jgi:hypothetical protein
LGAADEFACDDSSWDCCPSSDDDLTSDDDFFSDDGLTSDDDFFSDDGLTSDDDFSCDNDWFSDGDCACIDECSSPGGVFLRGVLAVGAATPAGDLSENELLPAVVGGGGVRSGNASSFVGLSLCHAVSSGGPSLVRSCCLWGAWWVLFSSPSSLFLLFSILK